jgi:hypothetical protein
MLYHFVKNNNNAITQQWASLIAKNGNFFVLGRFGRIDFRIISSPPKGENVL